MKKIFLYTIFFTGALQAYAFPPDVTLSNEVNMDFGTVEAGGLVGGTLSLGTDGSVTYTGDISGDGVGVAGQARSNPLNGATTAEVSCSTGATLCDASSNSLAVTGIEVATGNSRGAYGTGTSCNGIGNSIGNITLNGVLNQRSLFYGGVLTVPAATALDGGYGTNIACGSGITIDVVVP